MDLYAFKEPSDIPKTIIRPIADEPSIASESTVAITL